MTTFLYIADTHLGADPMGFQQQKGYPDKLPEILSALCKYLSANGGVDFILHGGDMIDSTTENNIVAAADLFDFGVPVYLCLGNHDLTTPDAVDLWLRFAPQFFIGGTPDYTVESADCVIHVAPNHWGDAPFYWDRAQKPHLSAAQVGRLSRELCARPDLPHVILTHSPVYGLPEAQTGFPGSYHCPVASFTEQITTFAARHANIRCILGAHNHLNMRIDHGGIDYVTVSSMVETPFEVKLFEVCPQRIKMSTISLSGVLAFDGAYDVAKSFVQGREVDRSLAREFASSWISTEERIMNDNWIHSKAVSLPTEYTRSMIVLSDNSLLTLNGANVCLSRDEGLTWEQWPMFPGTNCEPRWEYALTRCQSGALVVVYLDASTRDNTWAWNNETHEAAPGARLEVWSTRSLDEGRTWVDPVRLYDGYCGAVIGMIQTRGGRLVVPVQRLLYDPGRHAQVTYFSDDEGLSWGHSNIIDIGGHGHHDGCMEGMLTELNDGRLWMLLRTNLDRFWQAFSEDGGLSWRTILPTQIDASSSPAYLTRLSSGRLMMAWNRLYPEGLTAEQQANWERSGGDYNKSREIASWFRKELSVAFSEDDGKTWTPPVVLIRSPRNGMGYPFILERHPGLLWVMTRFGEQFAVAVHEADLV